MTEMASRLTWLVILNYEEIIKNEKYIYKLRRKKCYKVIFLVRKFVHVDKTKTEQKRLLNISPQ